MAYRETDLVRQRKVAQKSGLLHTAEALVREGGFAALTIQAVAEGAGIGVGTVYRYFSGKDELATEVFKRATSREVSAVREALNGGGGPAACLATAVEVFAVRAFAAPKLAWALIAEPVDPAVDIARLQYRKTYTALFETVVQNGIVSGEFAPQSAALSAAALVGAMAESLLGPLDSPVCDADTIAALRLFCLRAVGARC
ncbi:MAG: TetR/AcrR family transcriptional regulator [Zhongshania sp.]|uniref:TetR/AcrR family transcriptional regulator n=1 Tax=Zhongshania sp. TaxID=1971902 RepID=UPI00261A32F9|nr:TetR/AcrR family transcriptional regulator [Zhongshania sp.]MDF1691594.1 TetR/AcrR family transcriptional regulator [Zhongshania sp.]